MMAKAPAGEQPEENNAELGDVIKLELELKELAIASQKGDKKKHVAFLTSLTPLLRGIVHKNWWGDSFSHEDIVQDILIAVHSKLHTYNPKMPILPWVRAIAKYRIVDYLRSFMSKKGPMESFEKNGVTIEYEDTNYVYKDVENKDFAYKALESLPKRQSTIVFMLKIEGLSVDEIADRMDMTPSAVKVMAHRAYKRLAKFAENQLGKTYAG